MAAKGHNLMSMAAKQMLQRSQKIASPATQRSMLSMVPTASSWNEMPFPMPMGFPMPAAKKAPTFPMPLQQRPAVEKVPAGDAVRPTTPLMQVEPGLFAKLEGFHAGGSIKDRAVMQCTEGMLKNGKLKPGDTLCVSTSGNAGRSLLHVQKQLAAKGIEIKVKIFMPKRYLTRDVPSAIADTEGVDTVQGNRDSSFYTVPHKGEMSRFLHGLDGEFMECQQMMVDLAKEHGWAILDQHFDINSLHAHESTAEELIRQLPSITDVVCTTGTGGTASGLRHYLPAHVNVHARPAKPGDIDGITDVRRYSNFCDVNLLEGFGNNFFAKDESVNHQKALLSDYKITAGESTGAAFALAKEIVANNPNAQVVFIAADGHTNEATLYEKQVVNNAQL